MPSLITGVKRVTRRLPCNGPMASNSIASHTCHHASFTGDHASRREHPWLPGVV